MARTTVGILEAGMMPPPLEAKFGTIASMYEKLFAGRSDRLELKIYRAFESELPSSADECDAYLISGSPASVFDEDEWIKALKAFVLQAYSAEKKLLGICFGHQLLADVLGGRVERSDKGWGVGSHSYHMNEAAIEAGLPIGEITINVSHQDQVTQLPEGAVLLGGCEFCPNGAFRLGDKVLAMQCHPEYPDELLNDLIEFRKERLGEKAYRTGLNSLSTPLTVPSVEAWMTDFLTSTHLTD
ncbi:amidotransferase [Alphaproteobacteria bacterium]|nr:amidotransferase [Alphaproteobacteria bacterium]